MKGLTIAGLILAALSMNTAFLPGIGLRAAAPDMMLIVTLSLSLRLGARQGSMVGLAGGLLVDLLTTTAVGLYALVYMLAGSSMRIVEKARIQTDRVFIPALAAFVLHLLKDMLLLSVVLIKGVQVSVAGMFAAAVLPSAAVTALGMALFYQAIYMLCNVRYMRPRRETDLLDF